MRVWIIERDHEPMDLSPHLDTPKGREDVKRILNHLQRDEEHYHDAVLYERLESPGARRSRKRFEKWSAKKC